jgi:glucose-1-phosphate cytidylyltransferase
VKVAILAGGQGRRIRDEAGWQPKALVEIGGRPILWHILRYYAHFGFASFVIALGHRGAAIVEAFSRLGRLRNRHAAAAVVELSLGAVAAEVALVDTGIETETGGRIKRLAPHLDGGSFMLTWSDGLADVDLHALARFHRAHGRLATVTAVHPPPRFGHLELHGDRVRAFREKPPQREIWINGAFFVLEPGVLDCIAGDDTVWEQQPLGRLAADGQLMAFRHDSFWRCMDTAADRESLEDLWRSGRAPWKVWP